MKDPVASGDDVQWEVSNEEDIAIIEGVVGHETVKVGALKDHDFATSTVKVSCECIFEVVFICCNVDIAEYGGAGG